MFYILLKPIKHLVYDNISAYFLQITSSVLLHIFMYLLSIALVTIFLNSCMIARVVPIFKKGEHDKPTNYRPIAILTCF